MRLLVWLALGPAACGGSQLGPASSDPPIMEGPRSELLGQVKEALLADRFQCQLKAQALVCDASHRKHPTLVIIYAQSPPRVVVSIPFALQGTCKDAAHELNVFNTDHDHTTLSCTGNGQLRVSHPIILASTGIPAAELAAHIEWWAANTLSELRESGVYHLIR